MSDAKQSGHVLDSLAQYCDGQMEPSEKTSVKAHLETCEGCAAELKDVESFMAMFREIRITELAESLPLPVGDHVDEADLWYLADPDTKSIPDEFHEKMRHVLGCRQCYVALRDRRFAILQSSADPDLDERAAQAWDRFRADILKVFLAFKLLRLRISLGGPSRMRMLSEAAHSGVETVEREIGSPWEFKRAFGGYSFRVVITPRDFEQQTLEIKLYAIRLPEHSTDADLRAELFTSGAPGRELPFVDGQVAFGVLPLRDFQISVVDSKRGTTIGFIEIAKQTS